jgi:N-acetylneuraminic acid mutarotase
MGIGSRLVIVCLIVPLSLTVTLLPAVFGVSSNIWAVKTQMPDPTFASNVAVLDGLIYAAGENGSLEVYNPTTDIWHIKSTIPLSLPYYCMAACQNQIYILSPNYDGNTNIMQAYNPTTDKWTTKTPLPTLTNGIGANVVDDKIYVIGGGTGGFGYFSYSALTWAYDPANNSWSQMAPAPTAVAFYSSTVLDDKIYVIGGEYSFRYPKVSYTNLVQVFDPKTNQWTQGAPLLLNMSQIGAASSFDSVGSKCIYVFGGLKPYIGDRVSNAVNWTQIYDLKTNLWHNGTSMPIARFGVSVANVNDALYILGGTFDQNTSVLNLEYVPSNDVFESISPTLKETPILTPTQINLPTAISTLIPTSKPSGSNQNLQWLLVATVTIIITIAIAVFRAKKPKTFFRAGKIAKRKKNGL